MTDSHEPRTDSPDLRTVWSKVKGKPYSVQKAYFRELLRPYFEKALGQTIDESIAEGLACLDAMLDLSPAASESAAAESERRR